MKLKMPRKQKRLRATAQRAARYDEDGLGEEPGMRLSRAFLVVLALHLVAVGGIFLFNSLKNSHGRTAAVPPPAALSPRPADPLPRRAGETTAKPPPAGARTTRIHQLRRGETLAQVAAFYGVSVADIEAQNGLKPGTTLPFGSEIRIPSKASLGPVPLDVRKLVEAPRSPVQGPPADRGVRPGSARAGDQTPVKSPGVKALEEMASRTAAAPGSGTARASSATAPAASAAPVPAAVAGPASDAPPVRASLPSGEIYTVAKGDNPAAIAKRFGVGYDELLKVNGISDPRRLQIGQRLLIPKRQP